MVNLPPGQLLPPSMRCFRSWCLLIRASIAVGYALVALPLAAAQLHGQALWSNCPVWTPGGESEQVSAGYSRPDALYAECATLQLPLDYEEPDGAMINYFVKRVSSSRPKKDGAGTIWLLNGGPGFSGVTMECMLPQLIDLTEGRFAVVIPDHRGTGRSSPLFCDWEDGSAAFSKECDDAAMEHYGIQYLNHFTTSNAARDMHAAIAQIGRRTPERPVTIHAVSYGTILAQRSVSLLAVY